ncbi:hypothetical protein [Chryseobacterium profundimaris]|uniref:Uncharacterized protein n=1 Tax=Chryseobacterium profundimaris TaxID=1387275 RepID=A0ABY1NTV6_9FLAO|nr:hypothetical protein [Chryseobacterium profundimaris]SMP18131.1 hypothetical protein SAMN06264346_104212 [Chryseobacterium profundimaris]
MSRGNYEVKYKLIGVASTSHCSKIMRLEGGTESEAKYELERSGIGKMLEQDPRKKLVIVSVKKK